MPNLAHMHILWGDNVQEILGAIGKVGARWGARTNLAVSFFVRKTRQYFVIFQMADWFSPNLATTRESMCPRKVSKRIFENFPFRSHLPPPTKTSRFMMTFLQEVTNMNGTSRLVLRIPRTNPIRQTAAILNFVQISCRRWPRDA